MTVSLSTLDKANKLKTVVTQLLSCKRASIHEVAQVVSLIISSFPWVMYGPLQFRITEHETSETLEQNAGNFDVFISLTPFAREELQWWADSIDNAVNKIDRPDQQITIRTDACTQGWECPVNDLSTGSPWTATEKEDHVNYLELFAV